MIPFLYGAIMTACAGCGLFFLKSWRASSDRFFLLFALAFWAMAAERWALIMIDPPSEVQYYLYLLRLLAFILIGAAIIDKNLQSRR